MRYYIFCLFLLLASSYNVVAQTPPVNKIGTVSGIVVDDKNMPIPYATVTLLRNDNTVVNGDLTKEDGSFAISPTGAGNFKLRINALGYKEKTVNDIAITNEQPAKNLKTIILGSSSNTLNEVAVTAERRQMEMSIDKKTFNVAKNITATGGSAADVLQNVPSVTVGTDGNVSLRGKSGVTLLIDGKPATLLGADEASALQSLPASSIENVEVITNPSAKYDAQGMTGIINIITKKDKKMGFNGMITAGLGTRQKYNGGINLNLRNDKWNFYLNSNYRNNRNENQMVMKRHDRLTNIRYESDEYGFRRSGGWFTTIGTEYTLNKWQSFSLSQNINLMRFGNNSFTDLNNYNPQYNVDSFQQRYINREGGPNSYGTTLAHKWKFKNPKEELNTTVNYTWNRFRMEQDITSTFVNYSYGSLYTPVVQSAETRSNNSNWLLQSDYNTNLFKPDDKLEMGIKYQGWKFDSKNNPTIVQPNGSEKIDSLLLNIFKYDQNIYAAYASYSAQSGKLGYQAGLRVEQADYKGRALVGNEVQFSNTFLSLFPSAYLSYQIDPTKQLYLNYTRRTNRPNFRDLLPYIDISNPQDIRRGNPALEPEFINNFELNYSQTSKKGHSLMLSAYTQYTTNLIDRYRYFNDDGTSVSIPSNLNSGLTYGLEAIGRAQILPIWDAMLNLNFFRNEINSGNIVAGTNNTGYGWFAKLNTNLKLPAQFSIQLMANYESPKINSQSVNLQLYWIDLAFKKQLLKNKASITLNVADIFDTQERTLEFDMPTYYQSNYYNRETRIATLTLTYNFGKNEMKAQGKRVKTDSKGIKERNNLKQDENGEGGM